MKIALAAAVLLAGAATVLGDWKSDAVQDAVADAAFDAAMSAAQEAQIDFQNSDTTATKIAAMGSTATAAVEVAMTAADVPSAIDKADPNALLFAIVDAQVKRIASR